MPARPSTGVRSQPAQQFAATTTPGTALAIRPADRSARELEEKVVALEWRWRAMGRSIFPPWLDKLNCTPALLRRHLPTLLTDSVIKASLLGKAYAVASLDPQMAPASETPINQTAADLALYCYTTAVEGGIPRMAQTYLLHKWIFGETVFEMVWHEDLWARGEWAGRRFFRDLKAREGAEAKYDKFGNLEAVIGTDDTGDKREWTAGDGLEDFIVTKHLPLFNGPGQSDLLDAYQRAWRRHALETLRDVHLDKFVSPYIIVRTGIDGAPVEVQDPITKEQVPIADVIEPDVRAIKSRGYGILPPGVDAEALQLATRGEAEFQLAIDKENELTALGITGAYLQMMTANGIGTNMRGNSETARSTSELFVWAGMVDFCSDINTRATPRLIQENLGVAADYPVLALGGINSGEALQAATLYKTVSEAGGRPSRKALGKSTGVQLATDPDDALIPPTVAPLPPGTPGTTSTFRFAEDEKKKLTQRPARKLEVPTRYSSASPPKLDSPAKS